MGSNWIRENISGGKRKPPNGMYNDNTNNATGLAYALSGPNAPKKIRYGYGPGGVFNSSVGLTEVLDIAGRTPEDFTKNLTTTQTEKVLYINIPRMVIPLYLPGPGPQDQLFILNKSIVAGDVFFQLRYSNNMYSGRKATPCSNKLMSNMNTILNLPSVNYILLHLQKILFSLKEPMTDCGLEEITAFKTAMRPRIQEIKTNLPKWVHFMNNVTSGTSDDFTFENLFLQEDSTLYEEWFYRTLIVAHNDSKYPIRAVIDNHVVKNRLDRSFDAFVIDTCWDFMNTYMRLGGVFIGSDKQGGMDQESRNPCSFAPVDYVGTLQVAGKTLKVRNLWHAYKHISSGSIIGFQLEKLKETSYIRFQLSSNPHTRSEVNVNLGVDEYFFLVPSVYKGIVHESHDIPEHFLSFGTIDQMCRCGTLDTATVCDVCYDATAMIMPIPVQVFMRFKFYKDRDHRSCAQGYADQRHIPDYVRINGDGDERGGTQDKHQQQSGEDGLKEPIEQKNHIKLNPQLANVGEAFGEEAPKSRRRQHRMRAAIDDPIVGEDKYPAESAQETAPAAPGAE